MLDAARGASAGRITVVLPHYAYARSDKKDAPRISIGSAADSAASSPPPFTSSRNRTSPSGLPLSVRLRRHSSPKLRSNATADC